MIQPNHVLDPWSRSPTSRMTKPTDTWPWNARYRRNWQRRSMPRSEAVSTNCSLQLMASKAGEIYRVPIVAKIPDDFPWLTGVLEITRLLNIDVELNFRKCGLFSDEPWTTVAWGIASHIMQSTSGTIMFGSEMTKRARNY